MKVAVLGLALALAPAVLLAGHKVKPRGTPADARALLARAVDEVAHVGETEALIEFAAPKGPFVYRDLRVFCFGPDQKITVHPTLPVGTDVTGLRDADGKEIGKAMAAAASMGEGAVEHRGPDPATGAAERQVTVVSRAGSQVCGVTAAVPGPPPQ